MPIVIVQGICPFFSGQQAGTRSPRAALQLAETQREEKPSSKGAQGTQLAIPTWSTPCVLLTYLGRSAATCVCDPLHVFTAKTLG